MADEKLKRQRLIPCDPEELIDEDRMMEKHIPLNKEAAQRKSIGKSRQKKRKTNEEEEVSRRSVDTGNDGDNESEDSSNDDDYERPKKIPSPVKVSREEKSNKKKRKREDTSEAPFAKKKKSNDDDDGRCSSSSIREEGGGESKRNSDTECKRGGYLTCRDLHIRQDHLMKEERDTRCILLKNLPPDTKSDDLKQMSPDIVTVRMQIMKSKKSLGKMFAFIEFRSAEECKRNLEPIREIIKKSRANVSVDLAERKRSMQVKEAFDPKNLFVSGLEPGTLKSEVKHLFPLSMDIKGAFIKAKVKRSDVESGKDSSSSASMIHPAVHDYILGNDHVQVTFANNIDCAQAKQDFPVGNERGLLVMYFKAGKRQCKKVAKRIKLSAMRKTKREEHSTSNEADKNEADRDKKRKERRNHRREIKQEMGRQQRKHNNNNNNNNNNSAKNDIKQKWRSASR